MENKTQKKLPLKVKWLFASGDFAKTLLVVLTAAYSLYFYTNVLHMDSKIVATVILIAKIWDFINDPMMGTLVDRTKSKEGKCRIWIKYMSVPGGVILALNFFMPEFSSSGKIIWFAVTYVLQGMASTALMIPQNMLMARLSSDPVERATLNAYRGYFGTAANLIAGSFAIPFVIWAGNNNMRKGFVILGIVCGILYAINYIIVYLCTKGYEPVDIAEVTSAAQGSKEKVKITEVLSNWPWIIILIVYFCIMVAVSVASSTGLFYTQYNLQDVNIYSIMNAVAIVGSLAVYLVLSKMVSKFGNAKLVIIGSAIGTVTYLLRFISHDANIIIMYVLYALGNFGQGLATAVIMLVVYDSFIYMRYKTGKPAPEGLLVSGYSVAYKVGMAIATPIAAALLSVVPYVAEAQTQEASVLMLFFYENTLLPAIAFAVATLLGFALLKYDKIIQEQKAIEAE
ncbi:MAG: glycoside-pentoside-hexuronide (GPH):cation symporter [Clostridiales bacterium]|nr:glycoside-pentoside-hexuronide (GPH):cation symporter [Clostridiales bacterium]